MPEVLREGVPEDQADWTLFANAIKAVELGHIREGIQKYKERVMEAEKITTQLNILEQCTASNTALLNSPTKSIRECLDKTIISHPVATGTDPFSNNNSSGGNLFNTHHTTFVAQPKPALEDKSRKLRTALHYTHYSP